MSLVRPTTQCTDSLKWTSGSENVFPIIRRTAIDNFCGSCFSLIKFLLWECVYFPQCHFWFVDFGPSYTLAWRLLSLRVGGLRQTFIVRSWFVRFHLITIRPDCYFNVSLVFYVNFFLTPFNEIICISK